MIKGINVYTEEAAVKLAAASEYKMEREAEVAYASFARALDILRTEGIDKCPLFILLQRANAAIEPLERWLKVVEDARDHAGKFVGFLAVDEAAKLREAAKEEAQICRAILQNIKTELAGTLQPVRSGAWEDFREAESRLRVTASRAS